MLPDWLKKLLQAAGINTIRLEWKLRYWRESLRWERTPFARWGKILSYEHKFCSCGQLVHKHAKVCPQCGRTLSSRALYRVSRALGFVAPEAGLVWIALLLVIGAVFLVEVRLSGVAGLLRPPSRMLVRLGALHTQGIIEGEYWRLLSAGLIHIGLWHIAFNAIALSQLAPALEDEIGSWQFVVLVTLTQLGCTLASYMYHPFVVSAGASGIAFGLIGFGLAYSHRRAGWRGSALRDLYLKWALYGFVFGVMIGADNAGHLGGLLAGGIFGLVIPTRQDMKTRLLPLWRVLAIVSLAAWAYTILAMWRSVGA